MNALSPISVESSDWGTLSANGYVNSNPNSPYTTLNKPLLPAGNNLSRLADTPPPSVHSSANSSIPLDGQLGPPHRPNGNPSPPNSVARSSVGTNATALMDERKFAQMEAALAEHHRMLVRYLAPALRELRADPRQNPNARDKLVRLSASQFQELSTDVYDELTRREDERRRGGPGAPGNPVPKHLLPRQNFHPKRNQARQKLSTLQRDRFQQLAMDVFFELERRFPRFGRSASRAESIADRNSPSRQGFPLRSASRTGPDAGPEGFGPRSASRAGPDMGDFGPRSASRAGPDMDGFGPRSASRAGGPDMGGPDGFQRSASRGPPDMGPDGFGQPPFNGPMGNFQNDQVKPMAKMYQSNVMVPNKGTMIEEDSEAENPKAPNGHDAPFDDIQLKVAELTNKLREKDMELEKAHLEPKELNANFETERSRWNDLRDDLERKVKDAQALNDSIQVELAKVRSEHSALQRDMRGQEGNQRDVERQLRSALEEAQGNHRAQQDNLKMQLEDVQMQARMKEDVLLSQLEDARNAPTTRGFDDASDQWKSRCDMLEQELAEQRKLTDEVREETSGILQEMRALSQRSADAVEKEDALRDDVARLEKEVRLWKSRYAKSKSQARSLRSSSLGLPVAAGVEGLARDAAFVSDEGVVRDVHVMAFQVAVDEMLQLARGADPEVLTEGMKHVVVAVRHITTDMEAVAGSGSSVIGDAASSVGGQSTITGVPSANRCAKLRARVSTAANNLITATKAHGAAQGIAPVSLVDAAASHLTAAVVDVVRALKIRRSTADELAREDHDDVVARSGQLDLAATARTMMPPPAGRPAALASFSESSVAGGSAHGRNASGSSAGYSNYSRYSSRYSANTSPPAQVFSGEIKGFGMGMVRENGIEEFKNFLDDSTALLVRSIQPLVSTIRSPGAAGTSAAAGQIAEHVRSITAAVGAVVSKTEDTLSDQGVQTMDAGAAAALRRHCPPVLAALEGAVSDILAAQQVRGGAGVERIPPLAFRIARATKELVLRVERIESGEVTAGTELAAEF